MSSAPAPRRPLRCEGRERVCVECGRPIHMIEPRQAAGMRLRSRQPAYRHVACHELCHLLEQGMGLCIRPGEALLVVERLRVLLQLKHDLIGLWPAPWPRLDNCLQAVRAIMLSRGVAG